MMKQPGFIPVAVGLVVLAILIGGGLFWANRNDTNPEQSGRELPTTLAGIKSVGEIRTLAEPQANGAAITEIELETEDVGLIYKVKFSDGRILFFDAAAGTQITNRTFRVDDTDIDNDRLPANFNPPVSLEQARATATSRMPGKTIRKVEIEVEDGIVVYSFRFTDDSRVDVSTVDGTVTRVRTDSDSDNSGSGSSGSNSGSGSSGSGNSGSGGDDD